MMKCSPVEMRKNLEIVDKYKNIGIDFVAVPVSSLASKNELIVQSTEAMEAILTGAGDDQ